MYSRPLIVSTLLILATCMALVAGCQWSTEVDTDGDGKPDRRMTSEQLDRWLERTQAQAKAQEAIELAKAKEEAAEIEAKRAAEEQRIQRAAKSRTEAVLRDAKRRLAQADSSHTQLVAELQAESEEQLGAIGEQASDELTSSNTEAKSAIAALEQTTRVTLTSLAAESQRVSDEVQTAREAIEAQKGALGLVVDAVPQLAGMAGTGGVGTIGAIGTGLMTSLAGWLLGSRQGERRAETVARRTQEQLDAQWAEQERNAQLRTAELEQRRYVAQLEAIARSVGGLSPTLVTAPALATQIPTAAAA